MVALENKAREFTRFGAGRVLCVVEGLVAGGQDGNYPVDAAGNVCEREAVANGSAKIAGYVPYCHLLIACGGEQCKVSVDPVFAERVNAGQFLRIHCAPKAKVKGKTAVIEYVDAVKIEEKGQDGKYAEVWKAAAAA